ncbi:MAG TPA: hypothetical protein VI461_08595 [Chitinophagaceae bacterium]|nr:hypothetical protein [Chitinophagaceae bacterium]
MAPFYNVESKESSADTWYFVVRLDPKHPIYAGHFPGSPLVPGALLVQIVKELAETGTGKALKLIKADSIKFLSVIVPHESSSLSVKLLIINGPTYNVTAEMLNNDTLSFKMTASYSVD